MHLSMFSPEGAGAGGGGAGLPPAIRRFGKFGVFWIPYPWVTSVCQKSPGCALRTEQNFILYNISGHT